MSLDVGDKAPDFTLPTDGDGKIKLSDLKGQKVVLYFYPKDDTPGCTKEACAFRDAFDRYGKAGVTLFGVSRDTDASHRAFREKYTLPFPMVADPSGVVQRAYHVPDIRPGSNISKRVSFLVGPDGKIARVWPDVDPGVHATEVLTTVDALRAGKR